MRTAQSPPRIEKERSISERRESIRRLEACPADRYYATRAFSEWLCRELDPEDMVAQSMPDASPLKWHLAHTTWFFEMMILDRFLPDYALFHPTYPFLFNSYYNALGDRHARTLRGVLTRPSVRQIGEYRRAVDDAMVDLLAHSPGDDVLELTLIGLHHEEQHQELMLTDLKHLFSLNALEPAYCDRSSTKSADVQPMRFVMRKPGLQEIGHDPSPIGEREFLRNEFAFDNEGPRHRVFLETHALANRLVTNDEYRAFIEDDGYLRPELWLDDGWSTVRREGWHHPLYWRRADDSWREFTLAGAHPLVGSEPVSHISFFEADAYARWKGARLPTEAEWEVAASALPIKGNFVDSRRFHPASADEAEDFSQLFGDLWEWTSSAYLPYPGFTPRSGDLAEYNGKFMCNQQVLRGGSCVSSVNHLRPSYRNFFHAPDRWQFTGIRLAKEF